MIDLILGLAAASMTARAQERARRRKLKTLLEAIDRLEDLIEAGPVQEQPKNVIAFPKAASK